jgi:hypothetical protein
MTDITELLANAKPGDEFLTRNGLTLWYIGKTNRNHFVFEDDKGDIRSRHPDGRDSGFYDTDYDIVAAKPKTVTRWAIMTPDSAMKDREEALKYIEQYSIHDGTIVKVTFVPGEHQS